MRRAGFCAGSRRQRGNALFLILIAVALFAALSYAVTQSGRGGSGPDKEKSTLLAAEIVSYTSLLEQTATRMFLSGISQTQISFQNDIDAGYVNASCTTDDCKMFRASGGGATFQLPRTEWLDSAWSAQPLYRQLIITGNVCVDELPTGDQGTCATDGDTSNEDLVVQINFIRKDVCLAINKGLGITEISGEPPTDIGCHGGSRFTGSYNNQMSIGDLFDYLKGKYVGCFRTTCGSFPGSYHFYHVLRAR